MVGKFQDYLVLVSLFLLFFFSTEKVQINSDKISYC